MGLESWKDQFNFQVQRNESLEREITDMRKKLEQEALVCGQMDTL